MYEAPASGNAVGTHGCMGAGEQYLPTDVDPLPTLARALILPGAVPPCSPSPAPRPPTLSHTPNNMRILGIDPGSRATGYGFVDGDDTLVEAGVVRLDGDADHPDRLKQIYDRLTALIAEHEPAAFAIEMPVYGQNPQSMLKLGRAQAAAMMAALNAELPVAQYTPKEIKKSVTGNGNASKRQVRFMVASILSVDADDLTHDAADAVATALCHGNRDAHDNTESYTGWASFVDANPDRVSE